MAALPDGKRAVLTFDNNRTDATYGDKTGVAKGYVTVIDEFENAYPRVSFNIFNTAGPAVTSMQGAMVVDSSGNLHIVYTYHANAASTHPPSQNQEVRYVKATRSGDTFTLSARETVHAHYADEAIASIDIDIPGTSGLYPIVVTTFTNWAQNKSYLAVHHKQTNNSWLKLHLQNFDGLYHLPSVSIAASRDTGTNPFTYVVTYSTVPLAADQGDFIMIGRATLGNAYIGTPVKWKSGMNKFQNDGWREFSSFSLGNGVFLVTGVTDLNPHRPFFAAAHVNQATGSVETLIEPFARADPGGNLVKHTGLAYSAWSIIFETQTPQSAEGKLISYGFDEAGVYATLYDFKRNATTDLVIEPTRMRLTLNNDSTRFDAVRPLSVGSGDAGRFANKTHVGAVVSYGEPTYSYLFSGIGAPPQSHNIEPEDGEFITSGNPRLTALPGGTTHTNVVGAVEFQVAPDSNFVSGMKSYMSNPGWINGTNRMQAWVQGEPLTQRQYYMRSRVIDMLGSIGPWSPVTVFTVQHKPYAQNVSPWGGRSIGYSPTSPVNFLWTFTDPDPLDYQTAYQVVVKNQSTGATIHDSGKVSSSDQSHELIIAEANTEIILTWDITLWDRDDVASTGSPPAAFYLSKAPVVTITSPNTDPVTTATPIVSWSSVIFGGRTQKAFRITLTREFDLEVVYDSGYIFSASTSGAVPARVLKNKTDYILNVTVQDTNDVQGTAEFRFGTLWPLPMLCEPPVVDISRYQTDGYAYVTAIIPDVSTYPERNFISGYNVFRRSYESDGDEWIWLYQGMPSGQNFIAFKDWLLPSGVPTEYAFTMTLDMYGEIQIGNPENSKTTLVEPQNGQYWLIDTKHPEESILLPQVTDDSWTDEYEQADYVIINRGRVVEIGDRIGNTGSLTSKLRDRSVGMAGKPVFNSISNARLQSDTVGVSLESWDILPGGSSSVSLGEMQTFAPSPTGRVGCLNVEISGNSGDPKATLVQDVFRIKHEQTHYASLWLDASQCAAGDSITLKVEYWDSERDDGSVISTHQTHVTIEAIGSLRVPYVNSAALQPDYTATNQEYNWWRIDLAAICPSSAVKAKVSIIMDSSTSNPEIRFNLGGVSFTDSYTNFFDGYFPHAEWVGSPALDPSYSPGRYTARQQRKNIEAMKARQGEVLLRTPFGDVYRVQVGSIGVSRIAGVGSNEFVDVTIPYLELSDDK